MRKQYFRIINLKESQLRDTLCYSLGSLCNSVAAMVILLVVTRIKGAESSGIFSLAWSVDQLMLTVGWFNTRAYLVSDVQEKISFYEYRMSKVVSSIAMIIVGIIYMQIYDINIQVQKMALLLSLLMITDVFSDFFSSYFQHKGKLYIGGISYIVRNIGYLSVFTIILLLSKQLELAIIGAALAVVIWLFFFDIQILKEIPKLNTEFHVKSVVRLFIECFPLFIGSFITTFIMNIPKTAINAYMDYSTQAAYNILFMPTSVINMLNLFISVPFYGKLAQLWSEGKQKEFFATLYKIMAIVTIITLVVLVGGVFLGVPVLSRLYNLDLEPYKTAFLILIIGGGFYGFISLLTYCITVFRRQQVIVYVYLIGALLAQVISNVLVRTWGMVGAALTYSISLILICVGVILYIVSYVMKLSKAEN